MKTSACSPLLQGKLLTGVSLADYTTWRVGGLATQLYKPQDILDLSLFLSNLPAEEPLLWLGLGSNSLIRDSGFQGTVVVTQGCLKNIALLEECTVYVEAGVSCASMARFCARNHLAGGEFWAGIPGTMGGALRMNAGCFGGETWQSLTSVETMARDGTRRIRKPEEFTVAYRQVLGLGEEWFVAGTFTLCKGEKEHALQLIRELLAHRAETQPAGEYNCGSVFRNPPGHFAAQLIESCGLKKQRIGGAMVSEKHANFIINVDKASAQDIEALMGLVRDTVKQQTQVELIHEVHILGSDTW